MGVTACILQTKAASHINTVMMRKFVAFCLFESCLDVALKRSGHSVAVGHLRFAWAILLTVSTIRFSQMWGFRTDKLTGYSNTASSLCSEANRRTLNTPSTSRRPHNES